MRRLPIAVAATLLCFHATADIPKITLAEAMKKNIISVDAISRGGYKGIGIQLDLKNQTARTYLVQIEPGMTFVPKDTNYQNLVLQGNEFFVMKGHQVKCMELQTYCGKSYARAPRRGLEYQFLKQEEGAMQNVLAYAKKYEIPNYVTQHAVWMFTNHHSLRSVYSYRSCDKSRNFVQYISGLLGIDVPEFYTKPIVDNTVPNNPVYQGTVDTLYVDIHWTHTPNRNMHICVLNEAGSVMKEVKNKEHISSAGHTVVVPIGKEEYEKGTYFVRLYDDDNTTYAMKSVKLGEEYYY